MVAIEMLGLNAAGKMVVVVHTDEAVERLELKGTFRSHGFTRPTAADVEAGEFDANRNRKLWGLAHGAQKICGGVSTEQVIATYAPHHAESMRVTVVESDSPQAIADKTGPGVVQ